MAKGKQHKTTSNDIQNKRQKTKYRVIRTPLQTGFELNYSTRGISRVTLDTNPVINDECGIVPGSASDKWNIYVVICDTDVA